MIGIFIDDTRDLAIPDTLVGLDIEWHVFRSIREMRSSPVYTEQPVDYVCFDYYLDNRGFSTGAHAITTMRYDYSKKGWHLPSASFHSSDTSKNNEMRELWVGYDGPCTEQDASDPGRNPSVFKGEERALPVCRTGVRVHFSKNKSRKRGGRP